MNEIHLQWFKFNCLALFSFLRSTRGNGCADVQPCGTATDTGGSWGGGGMTTIWQRCWIQLNFRQYRKATLPQCCHVGKQTLTNANKQTNSHTLREAALPLVVDLWPLSNNVTWETVNPFGFHDCCSDVWCDDNTPLTNATGDLICIIYSRWKSSANFNIFKLMSFWGDADLTRFKLPFISNDANFEIRFINN